MSRKKEDEAFFKMVDKFIETEGYDINTPYPVNQYLQDLLTATKTPDQAEQLSTVWHNPETKHIHLLSCPPNDVLMNVYQYCMNRYGTQIGAGRALRYQALAHFFNHCRSQLDANGLNWLNPKEGSPTRKLAFLNFLLCYPVVKEKQFSSETIPTSALDDFLAQEVDV